MELHGHHFGVDCQRAIRVLEMDSIFKIQRQNGSKQNFLRRAEFNNRILSRSPWRAIGAADSYRNAHRNRLRKTLREFCHRGFLRSDSRTLHSRYSSSNRCPQFPRSKRGHCERMKTPGRFRARARPNPSAAKMLILKSVAVEQSPVNPAASQDETRESHPRVAG